MENNMARVGAQLFTVHDYLKTPVDVEETFKRIKKIGYNTVQFSGAPIWNAAELKSIADSCGIKIICTHIPYDDFKNNLSKVISEHRLLGAKYAGIGAMPQEYRTPEGVKKFAAEFEDIAEKLKAEGLGTTYHHHRFEFEKFNGARMIDTIFNESETFSVILDTYWVQAGGVDVIDFIKKHKNRFDVVHFKDMKIVDDKQEMCEVMEGNLNWAGILPEIINSDAEYAFVEQDICDGDPFDCLKVSFDNLKKVIG